MKKLPVLCLGTVYSKNYDVCLLNCAKDRTDYRNKTGNSVFVCVYVCELFLPCLYIVIASLYMH